MNIKNADYDSQLRMVQRSHLLDQLRRRVQAAQGNPSLLALLEKEAQDLAGVYRQGASKTLQGSMNRIDRTLVALQHLRVQH